MTEAVREKALAVLVDPELSPIVDMVLWRRGDDEYEAASAEGRVVFRRSGGN